jgi:NAD(P)H-hydrate epimerase
MQSSLTRAQSREIDRVAIEELGIPGIVLMEHAGRSVAQAILAEERAHLDAGNSTCAVFCGGGNNGGDGFVIARWLDDAGVRVECVCTASTEDTRGDARIARDVATRCGIPLHDGATSDALDAWRERFTADPPRIVVDALLGTGFQGALRADMARAIGAVNAIGSRDGVRTWAVDLPSGLDGDLGTRADPTVRADVTATFVAPKVGFAHAEARSVLGRVLVLPIGVPRAWIERVRARGR